MPVEYCDEPQFLIDTFKHKAEYMIRETLLDAVALSEIVDAIAPAAGVAVSSMERCLAEALREVGKGPGVVVTGSQHALGEWLGQGAVRSPRLERRLGKLPA